jgi:hypothetical protein
MAKLTPGEIEAIKNAGKPFTPEEGAALKAERAAIWSGESVPRVSKAAKPATAGIPEAALRAKALDLGVPVDDLTLEQVEEVRANLPKLKPVKAKTKAKK